MRENPPHRVTVIYGGGRRSFGGGRMTTRGVREERWNAEVNKKDIDRRSDALPDVARRMLHRAMRSERGAELYEDTHFWVMVLLEVELYRLGQDVGGAVVGTDPS